MRLQWFIIYLCTCTFVVVCRKLYTKVNVTTKMIIFIIDDDLLEFQTIGGGSTIEYYVYCFQLYKIILKFHVYLNDHNNNRLNFMKMQYCRYRQF